MAGILDWLGGLFGGGGGNASWSTGDVAGGASGLEGGVSIPDFQMPDSSGFSFKPISDFASKVSSGVGSALSPIGDIAKSVLPVAQLGATGMGIARGFSAMDMAKENQKILRQAQATQQKSAEPLQQFGQQELNRATSGQLDPAMEAEIERWKQGARAKVMDFFARSGQGDSTAIQSMLQDIELKAEAMKASALQSMKTGGVTALTSASQAGTSQAGTAQQQGHDLDQLIAEANRQLAAMGTTSA